MSSRATTNQCSPCVEKAGPTYQTGDIIKATRTIRISRTHPDGTIVGYDVQNDHYVNYTPGGSARFQMVKKAVQPAPKANDILTGLQIQARMWKRGTVVQCVEEPGLDLSPLLLGADGLWIDGNDEQYHFNDLNPDAHFKLLHVAR